ncbi:sodium/calcium exchanger membrane protein [Azorhizobium oxalatiphilum]|uniref:Sodium/calcium exchanger membrane protein n=1 Tax=Azorhizobium oxalatiphilum TaxID=980631 RepID=A0A917CDV6_9HYPH|nr:ionic transporter [Azorhizobium oxalatiphilum]GGF82961.1 sodium/calcium exchanger membrane protein [Azorhizobium oxalatiphilum]
MGLTVFAYLFPLASLGFAILNSALALPFSWRVSAFETFLLVGSCFAAVHHAEGVSARIRQPFGTLVLTLSVTVIEVSVLVAMMLNGENNPTIAREAVLSTVMFVCTGIVGACLLLGALRHYEQDVRQQGVNGYLSVIIAISVLCLLLPGETFAGRTGATNMLQIGFVMVGTVVLYGAFLFMQTVRHRDDFLPEERDEAGEAPQHSLLVHVPLLLCCLAGIVALSSGVAAGVEEGLDRLGLRDPDAVVGAAVVAMLLLPETITAIRAARNNELQRSINTALGSALATIGLTMPAMVLVSELVGRPLTLGIDPEDRVQLLLVLVLSIVSFGTGRTNMLNGLVHLVLFAIYVMTIFIP